jgi:hypothetical protein
MAGPVRQDDRGPEARTAAEPNNPEVLTLAVFLWDKTFMTPAAEPEKRAYRTKASRPRTRPSPSRATISRPSFGPLLRLQANMEKDRTKQQALLKEADALRIEPRPCRSPSRPGLERRDELRVTGRDEIADSSGFLIRAVRPSRADRPPLGVPLRKSAKAPHLTLIRHPHISVQD